MFKDSNRKTRTKCEICSKLTIKRLKRRSSVSIINFEQVNNAGWVDPTYLIDRVLNIPLGKLLNFAKNFAYWFPFFEHTFKSFTAWKVSKYGDVSGRFFPVFGLNTEIYFVIMFRPNIGKYGPEKTPYLNTFNVVINPFMINIPISYSLKTRENQRSSCIFRGYKMGILTRNGLKYKERNLNVFLLLGSTSQFFLNDFERQLAPPLTQDVNWAHIRRSEEVQDVFWTSYVRSIYVLCLRGPPRLCNNAGDMNLSLLKWKSFNNAKINPKTDFTICNIVSNKGKGQISKQWLQESKVTRKQSTTNFPKNDHLRVALLPCYRRYYPKTHDIKSWIMLLNGVIKYLKNHCMRVEE